MGLLMAGTCVGALLLAGVASVLGAIELLPGPLVGAMIALLSRSAPARPLARRIT